MCPVARKPIPFLSIEIFDFFFLLWQHLLSQPWAALLPWQQSTFPPEQFLRVVSQPLRPTTHFLAPHSTPLPFEMASKGWPPAAAFAVTTGGAVGGDRASLLPEAVALRYFIASQP